VNICMRFTLFLFSPLWGLCSDYHWIRWCIMSQMYLKFPESIGSSIDTWFVIDRCQTAEHALFVSYLCSFRQLCVVTFSNRCQRDCCLVAVWCRGSKATNRKWDREFPAASGSSISRHRLSSGTSLKSAERVFRKKWKKSKFFVSFIFF
jgi:hypothetical protein